MKQMMFVVADAAGMHARPASILAKEAAKYQSDIKLISGCKSGNLKSILGIMSLGIKSGETIEITAEGSDEDEALKSLERIVTSENLG